MKSTNCICIWIFDILDGIFLSSVFFLLYKCLGVGIAKTVLLTCLTVDFFVSVPYLCDSDDFVRCKNIVDCIMYVVMIPLVIFSFIAVQLTRQTVK